MRARAGCEECRGQGRILLAFHMTDRCSLCGGVEPAAQSDVDAARCAAFLRSLDGLPSVGEGGKSGLLWVTVNLPRPMAPVDLFTRWLELGGDRDVYLAVRVTLDPVACEYTQVIQSAALLHPKTEAELAAMRGDGPIAIHLQLPPHEPGGPVAHYALTHEQVTAVLWRHVASPDSTAPAYLSEVTQLRVHSPATRWDVRARAAGALVAELASVVGTCDLYLRT